MRFERREHVVGIRKARGYPWHGPPHIGKDNAYRIVSAACYEHKHILNTPERLAWLEKELLDTIKDNNVHCPAWCVLPNHYHVLVFLKDAAHFSQHLGRFHGRTSRLMNREDDTAGRKVWHRCEDRFMRSERHFYTSVNYIHYNPVRHGWASEWAEWSYSSIHGYLDEKGEDWLLNVWQDYPVKDYGEKWDKL